MKCTVTPGFLGGLTDKEIMLWLASGLMIGLMSAFAAHNKSSGWKKGRLSLAEACEHIYSDQGFLVRSPELERTAAFVAKRDEKPVDPVDFSHQLICLNKALGEPATVTSDAGDQLVRTGPSSQKHFGL